MNGGGVSTGSVALGRYVMVVGAPAGRTMTVTQGVAAKPPPELVAALEDEGAPTPAAQLEAAVEEVGAVADRIEHAAGLFTIIATGGTDPEAIRDQLDALLDLLRRLDRSGRFEEALALARSLSGVLTLALRWGALVEVLRIALHAARELADSDAVAWVWHELGSLALGAGDAHAAQSQLGEARRIRQELGDAQGLAATEQNLSLAGGLAARVDPRGGRDPESWLTRPRTLMIGGVVLVIGLLVGVAAPALDVGPFAPSDTTTTAADTTTGSGDVTSTGSQSETSTGSGSETSTGSGSETSTGSGSGAPRVTLALDTPTDGYTNTRTPLLKGTAGIAAGDARTVTIRLYAGAEAAGDPAQTFTADRDAAGAYRDTSPALVTGRYTARAEQASAGSEPGQSDPVTFVVDYDAPTVTLTAPQRKVSGPTVTVAGTAGDGEDDGPVIVAVYRGRTPAGEPVVGPFEVTVPAGGSWSDARKVDVAPGSKEEFVVTARQEDSAGNASELVMRPFLVVVSVTEPPSPPSAPPPGPPPPGPA